MIKISQFPNISTRFRGLLCNLSVLRRSGQPDPHARRHLHPRRVLLCVWRLPLWTPSQLPYLLYQGHHHEHDLCNHRLLPFCIGWFCFPPDCDVWSCYKTKTFKEIREGVKKGKKRSGWPLGLTPPPPKRSGKCENLRLWLSTVDSDYIRLETNFTQKNVFDHWPPPDPSRDIPWYPRF